MGEEAKERAAGIIPPKDYDDEANPIAPKHTTGERHRLLARRRN